MVFDPTPPNIDDNLLQRENWNSIAYIKDKEELPENAPSPRGLGFTISAYVDSDHVGDTITRKSRT